VGAIALAVAVVIVFALGLLACLLVRNANRRKAGRPLASGGGKPRGWRPVWGRRRGPEAPLHLDPGSPGLPGSGPYDTPHPQLESPRADDLRSPAALLGGTGGAGRSSQGTWAGPGGGGALSPLAAGSGAAFLADLERSGGTPRMHSARLKRAAKLYRDGALSHEEFQSVHARICAAASASVRTDLEEGGGGDGAAGHSDLSDEEVNFAIHPGEIRELELHALRMCKLLRLQPGDRPGDDRAGAPPEGGERPSGEAGGPPPAAARPALGDAHSRLNISAAAQGAPSEAAASKATAGKGADPDKEVALRTLRSIYTTVAALTHSPARKAKGLGILGKESAAGLPPPR